jgi:hypothetical protein
MSDEDGQAALRTSASGLVERLQQCESSLRHIGDTEHLQHREYARRARLLAMYLAGAVRAGDVAAYPPAFAQLRCALEQRAFDRLLFLGTLHSQIMEGVSDDAWVRWQTQPPEHLHSWERLTRDRVRIVWHGPQVVDERGRPLHELSVYYRWLKEYDPIATPSKDFDGIAGGRPTRKADMGLYSETQREIWREALAWKNLKANLLLNGLVVDRDVLQLDVHHRFLSMFVHPFSEHVTDTVYRQRLRGDWPTDDHYAEELLLLYVVTFAIDELRDFELMTQREPRVDLAEWDEVRTEVTRGEAQIAHLWPPGRAPHAYDRIHESNQRVFDNYDVQHRAGEPLTRPNVDDPLLLSDNEVRYYDDPLRRLARLHASSTEMMSGLTWVSPWPRGDAWFR